MIGIFLSACGSNEELEKRHFTGETDSWRGEILLELTTDPDYEKAHIEITYKGENNQPDVIRIMTVGKDNNPDTGSDAVLTEKGIYYKDYGNYRFGNIY